MNSTLKKISFSVMTSLFLLGSCNNSDDFELKTGDLLFRSKTQSKISEAINDVTNLDDENYFTHMGLVEVIDNEIKVIHADSRLGVCIQPLDSFLRDENGDSLHVEAFRLKSDFRNNIDDAVSKAKSAVGEPYNFSYIIDDEGFYCSELIYWAFEEDSVFSLKPMTFKTKPDNTFHEAWEKHYKKLGIEIPEGKPGCNPNEMATSENLIRLGTVN